MARQRARLLGISLLLVFVFASSVVGAKVVNLELWHGITGGDYAGLEQLINEFNELYEGKISVTDSRMDWNDYYEKVQVATVAGTAPDIGFVQRDRLLEMVQKNVLRPLDDLWDDAGWTADDFLPGIAEAAQVDGTYYGVPFDVYIHLLFYNEDHLNEAGIAAPPTNPEEFLAQSKKLTRVVGDKVERWGTHVPWDATRFYSYLWQNGGDIFGDNDFRQVTLADDGGQKAMDLIGRMVFEDKVAPPIHTIPSMWNEGVTFMLDGIWSLKPAQEHRTEGMLNLQVARADTLFGTERPGVRVGTHELVIFRQHKEDPELIDAAMTFIRFLSDNNIVWAENGQLPVRTDAVQSPVFADLTDHMIIAQQAMVYLPNPTYFYNAGSAIWDMLRWAFDPNNKYHTAPGIAIDRAAERLQREVDAIWENL